MFFSHADPGSITSNEILAELRQGPPPIVHRLALEDASFSPAFRIGGATILSTPHAESWIHAALREALDGAVLGTPQDRALRPDATLREMVRALKEVPTARRLAFAERLARVGSIDAETQRFLDTKFDNVVALLSIAERVELGCGLIADGKVDSLERLLRSSGSLAELGELVRAFDPGVLDTLSPGVREYVALTTILPELQRICAKPLDASQAVECQIETLDSQLVEALRRCIDPSSFADTRIVAELRATILDDLISLERDLAGAASAEAQREIVALYRAALDVELRYGVNITTGAGENLLGRARAHSDYLVWPSAREGAEVPQRWRFKDIEEIAGIFAGLPEGRLLLTGMIHRIELVDTLGENVLGARYQDDGRIKIARIALDHPGVSAQVNGVSSLTFVLTHELGHSFQIGTGSSGYVIDGGRIDFAPGEPSIDFREFASIAGWEVIDPSRYTLGSRFGSLILDGREVPCGEPFDHNGKRIVLLFNPFTGIVVSVDATAEFSPRWYSRTSPWEDFAEAFAYYFSSPETLIITAPRKFRHLEEEFRRYQDDPTVQRLLDASLANHGIM